MLGCVKVDAVTLQASSTSNPYNTNVSTMFDAIRDMETGTLGLGSKSDSDGIDCHMEKRTEFGAAALLAISAYGYGSTQFTGGSKTVSSTGNASGIYQLAQGNYEWMAAYYWGGDTSKIDTSKFNSLANAPAKYKDLYYSSSYDNYINNDNEGYGIHKGDGMFAPGFLGHSASNFVWVSSGYPVFSRNNVGLFTRINNGGTNTIPVGRAVVVCAD